MQVVLKLELEESYLDRILHYLNSLKIKIEDVKIQDSEINIIKSSFKEGELVKENKIKTTPLKEFLDEL